MSKRFYHRYLWFLYYATRLSQVLSGEYFKLNFDFKINMWFSSYLLFDLWVIRIISFTLQVTPENLITMFSILISVTVIQPPIFSTWNFTHYLIQYNFSEPDSGMKSSLWQIQKVCILIVKQLSEYLESVSVVNIKSIPDVEAQVKWVQKNDYKLF